METTTISHVPVADLTTNPENLRTEVTALGGLARSIKERGVIEPLIVVPLDGGGHRVVAGHRRLAAALEAGMERVPCWVRADLEGDADQVVTMLVENLHRQDLTRHEEAKGFAQLALLGVSDTKAARSTGVGRNHVKKARAVAGDPLACDTLRAQPGLTFDQALAISEVVSERDPDDAARLAELAVTAPGRFDHVVSRARQEREEGQRRAERHAELVAQGLTVVDFDDICPPAMGLASLTTADTPEGEFEALDSDDHAACPGHAVSIDRWDPDRLHYWCLDPAANGHRTRWPAHDTAAAGDDAEREGDRQERRTVIANNKAWRAAEPVRRDYVRKLLAGKRPPKGTLRYLTADLMGSPERFGRTGDDQLLGDLTATEVDGGWGRHVGPALAERAPDARLPLVLLAQHAADLEGAMDVHTWRHHDARAARYLAYLAGTGYTLSDIEQQVVDGLATETSEAGPDDEDGAVVAEVVMIRPSGPEEATDKSQGPAA